MTQPAQEQLYQRNLALIGQLYPHYTAMISSAPEADADFELHALNANTYTCRVKGNLSIRGVDASPDRREWIHGPGDPWKEAEERIKATDWSAQRLFVIVRPGLGYSPFLLYPNLRKGRHAQRMLIVEDRIGLFRISLHLFDWTDVLRSDRTILLLAANPIQAVMLFFATNPSTILVPLTLLNGSEWGEQERRILSTLHHELTGMAKTVHNASQEYIQDLRRHFATVRKDPAHQKRILLIEPEHDYLARPITEAFQAEGCAVETFSGNRRLLRFLHPYLWLVYTREHFPDVLLWMNRNTLSPEGERILKDFPIQKVLWFFDSPKRVETSKEEIEATDRYFSFDPTYLPYLEQLGGKAGIHLSTAAGIHPLSECEPEKIWPKREGAAISFMGALAAQRFQDVRDFWSRRNPNFVQILDGILEEYLADPSVTLEERFEASPAREQLPYRGFVVLYLEEKSTYLTRLRFLKPVKDLGLATYGGNEWGRREWAEDLTPCFTGITPEYREELPRVYFHSIINVNVFHTQCINSANPRVYDVLAAGGFLLSEYRPILEEEFRLNEHLVCFRTPEELREKARYYLEHEEEREAIARAGQRFVLEHATYRQRVQTMLQQTQNG
ncbi:MAG: glycosyltransferase family 1 protein [Candidatus Omnitrophota bacterium]|jgi:hypothetical protein|nr:MAG: glycosyltransferase family 1 protein [Candidatus Omnitrophota bacterium]